MCHHAGHCKSGADWTRREFLIATAATATVGGFFLRAATAQEAARSIGASSPEEWPDVLVAYVRPKEKYWLGWPGTSWENQAYPAFMKQSRAAIEKFSQGLKVRVGFEPEPLHDKAAVDQFLAKIKVAQPKGVVIFPLHLYQWELIDKLARSGVPTIIFAGLGVCFTGHIQNISRLPGVYLASSADFEFKPIRFGMKMIRTAHDLRRTRIAVLAGNETRDEVLEPVGLQLRRLPRNRFGDTLAMLGETPEVLALADDYQKAAQGVVEPSRTDLINAARNYHAALQILKEEKCNGITMDCLGAVYDRDIPCPPCMAWSRFLDRGIPAICEADINAVLSHSVCCRLLDKPGFMQDPVPETVHNTFIGAHCVCATRLHGYDQPPAPFILRSHSESDIGVSLQVLWPVDQEVTIMQFTGPDQMILGKGRVLRNLDTPPWGGCRTSVELATDGPSDTRDTKGFHQLFIAGDHVRDFQAYGQMYGIATEHI